MREGAIPNDPASDRSAVLAVGFASRERAAPARRRIRAAGGSPNARVHQRCAWQENGLTVVRYAARTASASTASTSQPPSLPTECRGNPALFLLLPLPTPAE